MNYVLGLDIGIGSVGWAVVRNEDKVKRVEDFGVRIFSSGEHKKTKERLSQQRRSKRSARRLIRRRAHRKLRLKNYLEKIGLVSNEKVKEYYENCSSDIISIRLKALDEKISPEEIAACLINICNRRGYRDFYEPDESMSEEERKEYEKEQNAVNTAKALMDKGKYRTVSEMIAKDDYFKAGDTDFRKYRNNQYDSEKILFTREMMQTEALAILRSQSKHYPQLNDKCIETIINIIFSQRDFEDGPGNVDDKFRQYMGFIDSIGNCPFYKEEKRGFRFTLIADIYALVNVLSQYIYISEDTGELVLSTDLANALVNKALSDAHITATDIKNISKQHGFDVNAKTVEGDSLSKCLRFSKAMKPLLEKFGYSWIDATTDYRNPNALINKISTVLNENITPKRRSAKLDEISGLSNKLKKELERVRASGTANVSNKYMLDSIEAFLNGEAYGNFQANFIKRQERECSVKRSVKLPPINVDDEFYNNPVVIRSINETRKVINAIIERYGSPQSINIETAQDLNKSLDNRKRDEKHQNDNAKRNDAALTAISDITGYDISKINPAMIERYKLGEEQGWKCLYSGEEINDKKEAILNDNHYYEVDHIVPFSLILDNTLNNKALVKHGENQDKGQRTPLMYLRKKSDKIVADFKSRVNAIYGNKRNKDTFNKTKYNYLMLKDLDDSELLDEWKSRNINDTRYISKYLVRYLNNNLFFAGDGRKDRVYAVKGAITSMLRRQWLNKDTWGVKDKKELKDITYLDHAVDAIVIANCIPAYVEMAALNKRLKDIFYSAGKTENEEYNRTLQKGLENLFKFYQIPRKTAEPLLRKKKNTPSLIPNLRDEVDKRVTDCQLERYFNKAVASYTDEEIESLFKERLLSLYDDKDFAESITMPIISFKQERKVNKSIGNDTLLSIKEIDGELFRLRKKAILDVKKKEIGQIYTNDKKLITALSELMAEHGDETTVEKALKEDQTHSFDAYSHIHSVKIKEKAPSAYMAKDISDNNRSYLDISSYYCVEVYSDAEGKTHTTGIPYAFLKTIGGKLFLSERYSKPADYDKHIMYLFQNDYLTVYNNKNEIKFRGYFRSVKSINRSVFYCNLNTCPKDEICSISTKDTVTKYSVDILGKMGGKIRCGEPLLSAEEKE